MNPRLFSFIGGETGPWQISEMRVIVGETLAPAQRLNVVNEAVAQNGAAWAFHGVISNERYAIRAEKNLMVAKQQALGTRPEATCATLIPIRKSAAWWALTQDERRQIFEESSKHTEIGLKYLPAIARRLHHCRDLAESEPFDFLTWFDYAPENTAAFDELLGLLRETEEWKYVNWEVEVRVIYD